jgi:hypothetical protein
MKATNTHRLLSLANFGLSLDDLEERPSTRPVRPSSDSVAEMHAAIVSLDATIAKLILGNGKTTENRAAR